MDHREDPHLETFLGQRRRSHVGLPVGSPSAESAAKSVTALPLPAAAEPLERIEFAGAPRVPKLEVDHVRPFA